MNLPFDENKIFGVSEISSIIREMLKGVFSNITIEGEISNLKVSQQGHIYFNLKDENAVIKVSLFRGYIRGVNLKEGAKVKIKGDIDCYVKSGQYQLIAKSVEVKTIGDLYAQYEALKAKLKEEGLFDASRKLPLPRFPSVIGVITSSTGAALRDIISVLRRRAKHVQVILAPAVVQGAESKDSLISALRAMHKITPRPDVILFGRGGGSIEDLWSFNEEEVVREVANTQIPIISCIGHETDFTLTDFVASLRAPTPSVGAEIVVNNAKDILNRINDLNKLLKKSLDVKTDKLETRLKAVLSHRILKEPSLIFASKEQFLDDLTENLFDKFNKVIDKKEHKLVVSNKTLLALSPEGILKRGYAIIRRASDNKIVQSSLSGEKLKVQTSKDNFEVQTL